MLCYVTYYGIMSFTDMLFEVTGQLLRYINFHGPDCMPYTLYPTPYTPSPKPPELNQTKP